MKRLRACHDDKEKEALSLRRALERLRLEKEEESAALATDKAYICKLEAKVAAQATSEALLRLFFREQGTKDDSLIPLQRPGKWKVDLKGTLHELNIRPGVDPKRFSSLAQLSKDSSAKSNSQQITTQRLVHLELESGYHTGSKLTREDLRAGLEQLEKHSALRARNKELQESVQSLHAVLASTEAELGSRNEEVRRSLILLPSCTKGDDESFGEGGF